MANGSIKFINYEEISTAIMDVVMPDRDTSDASEEVARQLKLMFILNEKLLSTYLDSCLTILKFKDNEGKNLLLYYTDEYRVEMKLVTSDFEPAVRAEIELIKNKEGEKEEDLDVIRPDQYKVMWKYNLYPGYKVDDEPKSDTEREIIVRLKFIKDNKLDECYDKICGIYFLEFMKYAKKCLHSGDDELLKDFTRLIRVRPDYIISPVSIPIDTKDDYKFSDCVIVYDRC